MNSTKSRILIVEDEADISGTLQAYLGRRGFQVSTTASGLEALPFIEIFKPDVVILDFALNDLDGREVLRRLRETDQKTRVVVITGQMLSEKEISRVHTLGIAGYFNKPIVLEKLGQAIGELTGRDLKREGVPVCTASGVVQPDSSSFQGSIHRLVNLMGIIRNKCENFVLSRDEGIYRDKSEAALLDMADALLRDIPQTVDHALDVIDRLREERGEDLGQ